MREPALSISLSRVLFDFQRLPGKAPFGAHVKRNSGEETFLCHVEKLYLRCRRRRKKNLTKGELALKHAAGLGSQPNVVPVTEPILEGEPRPVEVGWHPVGGLAGKWFAEQTGLGKMITDSINKYPDPTQHWAVLVGDYAHQLWMVSRHAQMMHYPTTCTHVYVVSDCSADNALFLFGLRLRLSLLLLFSKDENFDVIYTNEKVNREEWRTFKVGETRFNDDAVRRAGEPRCLLSLEETGGLFTLPC